MDCRERQKPLVRIIANASWLTGARVAGEIFNLLLFIVLSRYFGPGGIGQYAYGFAVAGFAFSAVNLGFEDYAIRECAQLPLKRRSNLIGQLAGIQIRSMVCVMAGLIVLLLLTKPSAEKALVIVLLSAQQIAFALTRTLFTPALAEQRMMGPAIAEVLCRVGVVFSSLSLVLGLHASLCIALIPFPVGGLVLLVIASMSARHYLKTLRLRVTWDDGFRIVRSAWPFSASLFVFYLRSRVSFVIIPFILGDVATGIYASSLKFLEVGVLPLAFLGLAAYPELSRLFREDGPSFVKNGDRLLRVALVAGGMLTWALFYFVPTAVIPIFGDKFAPASSVIKSMAVLGMLMALSITMVRLLLAMHLQIQQLRIFFWAVLLNIILTVALLPLLGVFGAVAASVISLVVSNMIYLKLLQKKVVTTKLTGTVVSFLMILLPATLVGTLCTWLTPYKWLPSAASLITFGALVLLTGFLPLPKTKKSRGFIGSMLFGRQCFRSPDE